MEPWGLLQLSQKPATTPYLSPHKTNLPPYFPKINSNIILPSTPRSFARSRYTLALVPDI